MRTLWNVAPLLKHHRHQLPCVAGLPHPFGPLLEGLELGSKPSQTLRRDSRIVLADVGDREEFPGEPGPLVGLQRKLAQLLHRVLELPGEIDEIPCCVGILAHSSTMAGSPASPPVGGRTRRSAYSSNPSPATAEPPSRELAIPVREGNQAALRQCPEDAHRPERKEWVKSVTAGRVAPSAWRPDMQKPGVESSVASSRRRGGSVPRTPGGCQPAGTVVGRNGDRWASYASTSSTCESVMPMSSSPSSNRQRV